MTSAPAQISDSVTDMLTSYVWLPIEVSERGPASAAVVPDTPSAATDPPAVKHVDVVVPST